MHRICSKPPEHPIVTRQAKEATKGRLKYQSRLANRFV
jgi:hypothetical protein